MCGHVLRKGPALGDHVWHGSVALPLWLSIRSIAFVAFHPQMEPGMPRAGAQCTRPSKSGHGGGLTLYVVWC